MKTIRTQIQNQKQWTIGNKRLNISNLHGHRFYEWFDQQFNLSELYKE